MPAWIHERAEHILAKNPSMPKGEAFAIATQQSHAVGKSPKGYGTEQGRATAKAKFDTPKDDKKTANPGQLRSPKMEKKASPMLLACMDELQKIAAEKDSGWLDAIGEGLSKINRGGAFTGGTSKTGPSKGFLEYQKQQAAKRGGIKPGMPSINPPRA